MKAKGIVKLALYTGILMAIMSCNKDSKFDISEEVENTFNAMYPNASSLEWSMIDGYVVGEFRSEGYYCKAWFQPDGKWLMTETSDIVYNKLSGIIKSDFESKFSPNNIDNVYKVEFSSLETRYIVEVEINNAEIYSFYLVTGEFLKQVDYHWNNRPIVISQEILNYIYAQHESPQIIDANMHSSPIKVKINEKSKNKVVCFASVTEWLATYWDIAKSEVSSALVKEKLEELLQPSEEITKVYQMNYSGIIESIYIFEINNGKTLYIKVNGIQVEIDGNFL